MASVASAQFILFQKHKYCLIVHCLCHLHGQLVTGHCVAALFILVFPCGHIMMILHIVAFFQGWKDNCTNRYTVNDVYNCVYKEYFIRKFCEYIV